MSDYKVLNNRRKEIRTDITIHPGEILQMELEARQLKKSEFASMLVMHPAHFSDLLH